ncbi:MerR family DNA-binding transcriptional regulator [Paenibacillus terreus]|uniref:MerR family DNA-binding transcriptional regulator n=1 Tax=Paenibacillus terreus TaxID=1387834 RepID=A0ABV5BAC7_9BACL
MESFPNFGVEFADLLFVILLHLELSNVTIKMLHHYHNNGLLLPYKVNESGYRLAQHERAGTFTGDFVYMKGY